jgi:hypothetical protein
MPYRYKKEGSQYCVYLKDGGKKVGCTDGNKQALNKYLAALHINVKKEAAEQRFAALREAIRTEIRKYFKKKSN